MNPRPDTLEAWINILFVSPIFFLGWYKFYKAKAVKEQEEREAVKAEVRVGLDTAFVPVKKTPTPVAEFLTDRKIVDDTVAALKAMGFKGDTKKTVHQVARGGKYDSVTHLMREVFNVSKS